MEKMINSAKNLHILVQGLYIVLFAVTCLLGIGAIVVWLLPDSSFYSGTESIVIGPLTMEIKPDGMLAPIWVRAEHFNRLLGYAILVFFMCRLLRVLDRILEPMSLGQPFNEAVAPSLKKLAWFSLLGGVVYEICTNIWPAIVISNRYLESYFNMEVIQEVTVDYEIRLWFLPLFMFLMLMSHVFRYGQHLQQLEDETL